MCFFMLMSMPDSVSAVEIAISCDDVKNPSTCTVSPEGTRLTSLISTIDSINNCTFTGNEAECKTNLGETFACSDNNGAISCTLPGQTTVFCSNISTNSVNCTLSTPSAPIVLSAFQRAPLTPPQSAMAGLLAQICTTRTVSSAMQRDCDLLLDAALSGNNTSAVTEAISQLTPDAASAPVDASQQSVRAQNANVSQRFIELRSNTSRNFSSQGLKLYRDGSLVNNESRFYSLGSAVRGGAASADDGEGLAEGRLGGFVNGSIYLGKKENTANERGSEFDGVDMTAGVDYRINPQSYAGVAFGYSSNETVHSSGRGKLTLTGFNLIFYGSYYATEQLYFDASLSFGGNEYDQERRIQYSLADSATGQVTTVNQTASADFFGEQLVVSLASGYDFSLGAISLTPYAQLQITDANTEGYNERISSNNASGSGWVLRMNAQNFQSLLFTVGGQLSVAVNRTWGVLVPQVRVEWVNEFKDDLHFVEGNFIGDPNRSTFRLPTNAVDDNYFNLGFGLSAVTAGGSTAYFYYQTQLAFDNLTYNTFSLGYRWEF